MQCMKCGREIPAGQVFCEECLADMEKYPVKPGTAIRIPPRREEPPVKKAAPRRPLSPEEQVKVLKRRLWIVSIILTLVLALVAGCLYLSLDYIRENFGKPLPGQNYSTAETTAPTGTTETN